MNNVYEKKPSLSELLAQCHLKWKRHLSKRCLSYGLSLKQAFVLKLLKNKTCNSVYLSQVLYADKPTIHTIVANLKKNSWIISQKDNTDKRNNLLSLSQAGLEKIDYISTEEKKYAHESPFSCLDHKEKEQLRRILEKINLHLEQNFNNIKE